MRKLAWAWFAACSAWASIATAQPLVQRDFADRDHRFIDVSASGGAAVFRATSGTSALQFDTDGVRFLSPAAPQANTKALQLQPGLRYQFDQGAQVAPQGALPSPTRYHWLVGPESGWRKDLGSYQSLAYRSVWPGVDVVFRGQADGLKYQFELAPGANAAQVQLLISGATQARLTDGGALEWSVDGKTLRDEAPLAYQPHGAQRTPVPAQYRLQQVDATTWRVGFTLGSYDPQQPLVIDPAWLGFAGLVGGSSSDVVNAVARDDAGNTYACGVTSSNNLGGSSSYQGKEDAFIAMFNAKGQAISVTYLGGNGDDRCRALALDANGLVMAGSTTSTNLVLPGGTDGQFRKSKLTSDRDAWVVRLNTASSIAYAGVVGGSQDDQTNAVALDASGRVYIAGGTESSNFPNTSGLPPAAFQPGDIRAFVARVNATGNALEYTGFVGTNGSSEQAHGIAADSSGSAYVVGETNATTSLGTGLRTAANPRAGDPQDGFAAKVLADGSGLAYLTYLTGAPADAGHSAQDRALAVRVRADGSILVAGETDSASFPANNGGARQGSGPQNAPGGGMDGFLLQLGADGSTVGFASYIGGSGYDSAEAVAENLGAYYVAGNTVAGATAFPTVATSGLQTSPPGQQDGFVARLDTSTPAAWKYAGYLGTSGNEAFYAMNAGTQDNQTVLALGGLGYAVSPAAWLNKNGATPNAPSGGLSGTTGLLLQIDPLGPPAQLAATSGGGQDKPILTAFDNPLAVTVTDIDGQLLPRIVVTFTAPGSGASLSMPVQTATTDSNGIATLSGLQANGLAGTYSVIASAGGKQTSFTLTNDKGAQTPLVISASSTSITYGATLATGSNGGDFSTGAISYQATPGTGSCTVDAAGVVTGTGVGTCSVQATKAGDANYLPGNASNTLSFTITPAPQAPLMVTSTPPSLLVQQISTLSAQQSGNPATGVAYNAGPPAVCSVSGSTLTANGTGQCTVTATKAGDTNHLDATGSVAVQVTAAPQAPLVIVAPATLTYGDSATLSFTGGSGTGAVSWSLVSGPCTLTGTQLQATSGTGSCVVHLAKAGDTQYQSATAPDATVALALAQQAALSINAAPNPITVGGTSTLAAQGGSGTGQVNWSVTGGCSLDQAQGPSTTLHALSQGTCSVTATKAADTDYQLATASQSVAVDLALQAPLTLTAAPPTIAVGQPSVLTAGGGSGSGALTYAVITGPDVCTANGSTITGVKGGTCTVQVTKAGDGTYALATAQATITVTRIAQTPLVLTATPVNIELQATSTLAASGGSGSGALSYVLSGGTGQCTLAGTTVTGTAVGTCQITATKAGDDTYNPATASATVSVGLKTQTISFTLPANATLGTPPLTLAATSDAGLTPIAFSTQTPDTCQVVSGMLQLQRVGLCTVRAQQAGNASYGPASADASITLALPAGATTQLQGSTPGGTVTVQVQGAPGSWIMAPVGPGPLDSGGFIPLTGNARSPASAPPAGLSFPYGLFGFVGLNGPAGSEMVLTVTYPQALPANARYWKYGATSDNATPHWYVLPGAVIAGNTVTLHITDGQLGDADLTANSVILDPGGVGVGDVPNTGGAIAVPALNRTALAMLACLMALACFGVIRRRAPR